MIGHPRRINCVYSLVYGAYNSKQYDIIICMQYIVKTACPTVMVTVHGLRNYLKFIFMTKMYVALSDTVQ